MKNAFDFDKKGVKQSKFPCLKLLCPPDLVSMLLKRYSRVEEVLSDFCGAKYSEQEFPKILSSSEVAGYVKNGVEKTFCAFPQQRILGVIG